MAIIDNAIVSMFDILGFSSLLWEEDLEKIKDYMIGIEKLTDSNSDGVRSSGNVTDEFGNVLGKLIKGDSENKLVEYKFAFDTMIYYTVEDEEKDFYNIIVITAKLLAYSYFLIGLPIRGAISYGELYVDDKNIFGKSLIDAHKYEAKQEWSGCILSPELINRFKDTNVFSKMCMDNLLLEYEVPIKVRDKKGCMKIENEKFHTINWMQYAGKNILLEDFKKQWSALRKDGYIYSEEVKRKLENTARFREYSLGIDINDFRNYQIGYTIMI